MNKIIIVLCGEARDKAQFEKNAFELEKIYGSFFKKFIVTVHPVDMPGEIPGKGSNLNYAGHLVQQMIDGWQIPYEDIVVSSFDIDTRVHKNYFAHLSYYIPRWKIP